MRHMLRHVLLSCLLCTTVIAQPDLTITTWNIEHLGSPGRGFGGGYGGYGSGSIPPRDQPLPTRTDNCIAHSFWEWV
ncbi:MAG: hypothetical protein AB1696_23475 [Planctomycetota bacterium]